ncbi:lipopolysaccharide assembly protein LapA domain-containing protein [Neobacillus sp.]|uniref:LapA family protein n=1 Tax=Neobacillus sp. TaxID=2675273 RepID=UPI00289E664D|nr:lipopolysaccharide assembly protein LapA domain-containing protein [Neobacillus sp.]
MRIQWNLILALIFTFIVAIFAVLNVSSVKINYLFGNSEIPIILIIIGSALLGGLVVGMFGTLRQFKLQMKVKKLEKDLNEMKSRENQVIEQNADMESN